jgi:hypothetical protein
MNLPPVLRQRYLDTNGNPLAGGLLYTYQSGTTTPQATYTDSAGGTPSANPIVLDANGEAAMWLDPALSYKFVLKNSAGSTQWTVDSVVGLLTAGAVVTASIADDAVTTAKLADDAVTADILKDSGGTDADRAVTTNHIRDSAVTTAKIAAANVTRAKLAAGGIGSQVVVSKTADFTATDAEDVILYDLTSAARTLTLPTAVGISGRVYTIKKTDSSANALTVDGATTETIDGVLTRKVAFQNDTLVIVSDGTNWKTMKAERIAARYSTAAAPSIANNGALVPYDTVTYDPGGYVTTGGAWKFTAPIPGLYRVTAAASINAAWTSGQAFGLRLYKNGSHASDLCFCPIWVTGTTDMRANGSDTIQLAATDYVHVVCVQNSGGALTLDASALENFITIERIGD